jgi:hypothetical protein
MLNSKVLAVLRWVVRVAALACVTMIVMLAVGEGFMPARIAWREWVGLVFFPLGVGVGMLLGWWKESLGGAITTFSLIGFYFIYGLLLNGQFPRGWVFLAFSLPGVLFLLLWVLQRLNETTNEKKGKPRPAL